MNKCWQALLTVISCLVLLMGYGENKIQAPRPKPYPSLKPQPNETIWNFNQGEFGEVHGRKPIYHAHIETNARVNTGEFINILVHFTAFGAKQYIGGPDYVVLVEWPRFNFPVLFGALEPGYLPYQPGYYTEYGFLPVNRPDIIKTKVNGDERFFWRYSSPSRRYNDWDYSLPPNAIGRFKAPAFVPAVRSAIIAARLQGIGQEINKIVDAPVFPIVKGAFSIGIMTFPVLDANNQLVAIDISFSVPMETIGTVKVCTLTGRPVKTIVENVKFNQGTNNVRWDLTDANGQQVIDGKYLVKITAQIEPGLSFTATETILIQYPPYLSNLTLQHFAIMEQRREYILISFNIRPDANGKVEVLDSAGQLVKTVVDNTGFFTGVNSFSWDLTDNNGRVVPDGHYTIG